MIKIDIINNKQYNDFDYVVNHFHDLNPICFKYKGSFCTIHHEITPFDIPPYGIVIDREDSEMEMQDYNSINELFENTKIKNYILKDIWSEVEIVSVSELNKF